MKELLEKKYSEIKDYLQKHEQKVKNIALVVIVLVMVGMVLNETLQKRFGDRERPAAINVRTMDLRNTVWRYMAEEGSSDEIIIKFLEDNRVEYVLNGFTNFYDYEWFGRHGTFYWRSMNDVKNFIDRYGWNVANNFRENLMSLMWEDLGLLRIGTGEDERYFMYVTDVFSYEWMRNFM